MWCHGFRLALKPSSVWLAVFRLMAMKRPAAATDAPVLADVADQAHAMEQPPEEVITCIQCQEIKPKAESRVAGKSRNGEACSWRCINCNVNRNRVNRTLSAHPSIGELLEQSGTTKSELVKECFDL